MSATIPITVQIPVTNLSAEAIEEAIIRASVNRVLGITTRFVTDEDGDNEEEIPDTRALDRMKAEVERQVGERIAEVVAAEVPATVREVLNGTFQPMTRWGEKDGGPTTIRDMVHGYAKKWIDEAVDARGESQQYRTDGVRRPRLHWIVMQHVEEAYKATLKAEVDAVAGEIKPMLRAKLSEAVSETVSRLLGVSK